MIRHGSMYIYKIGQQFPCQNHTKRTSSPRVLTAEALRRLAPEIRCWLRKRRPPPCRRRPRRRALARGPARRLPEPGEQSGSANPSPPTGPRGGHGGPSPARGRDGVTRRPGVGVATMDRGPCGFAVLLQPPQTRRGGPGRGWSQRSQGRGKVSRLPARAGGRRCRGVPRLADDVMDYPRHSATGKAAAVLHREKQPFFCGFGTCSLRGPSRGVLDVLRGLAPTPLKARILLF